MRAIAEIYGKVMIFLQLQKYFEGNLFGDEFRGWRLGTNIS